VAEKLQLGFFAALLDGSRHGGEFVFDRSRRKICAPGVLEARARYRTQDNMPTEQLGELASEVKQEPRVGTE